MWWLVAALLLGIIEMISLSLVFAMLGGGAAAAALVAGLGGSWPAQVIAAAAVAAALLVTLRPWLLRHLRARAPLHETNAAALVGREATVIAPVDSAAGRIKLAGEVWSARTTENHVLEPGTSVTVARIDGATAVVVALAPAAPR